MKLTPLDLGIGRFLEFSFTLVYPEVYAEEDLKVAARALLAKYPLLGSRVNFLRSELRPREGVNIFQSRHIDGSLSDFADLSSSTRTDDNVKSLGKLFAFAKGLWQSLRQPVILIRAVFLNDATVIRFITQHPLCDASGSFAIAQAYCAILNGVEPPDLAFDRPSLKLKDAFTQTTNDNQPYPPPGPSVLDRLRSMFRWSLRSFNNKGGQQSLRDIFHPSDKRVDHTFHVPSEKMRVWRENAREHGFNVTENDLLTAFIHQATYQPNTVQDFSLILGIRRELENDMPMHNSCFLIPIDMASAQSQSKDTSASLNDIAAEVRRAIVESRHPHMLTQLLEYYSKPTIRPMMPQWYGRRAPQSVVTSWTHLPFFKLEIQGTKPSFFNGELDMWEFLKKFGVAMDDCSITWKADAGERPGYCIRGRLHRDAWRRMEEMLDQMEM
ncbi:hypothetical protein BJX65DRAFT_300650 [Aspergillus insuetus]